MNTPTLKSLRPLLPTALVAALGFTAWSLHAAPEIAATTLLRGCQELKELRDELRTDQRQQAADLAKEISKVNAAPAEQQVALLTQALTHLTEQQSKMNVRLTDLDDEMLQHQMLHIQLGSNSIPECPLLKRLEFAPRKELPQSVPTSK